ncbi:MAG TPA: ChaN family lipoprotein [Rhodocyclaceae bacterium]|nr:ChaN family lipoprotein [Rhodocyclaceae bacterium]
MNPNPCRMLPPLLAGCLMGLAVAAGAHENPGPASPAASACLQPGAWMTLEGDRPRPATAAAVLADMLKQDVVLLGEHHDHEDDHHWQLQALAALHAQRPNMVIGFEMFPRRLQPVLDRWVAGELTAKQLFEESEWDRVWNVPSQLYLPLFQFARINRIPMVALNVDQKLNKAILEKGWDQVPEADREGVGRPAPPPAAYQDFLLEVYGQHGVLRGKENAKPKKTDPAFRRFVESQTAWDRAMAEALARQAAPVGKGDKPLVVGVMGSGHVRYGYGVPYQLKDLGIRKVGTLLPVAFDADCKGIRAGLADALFTLPKVAMAKPEPPRLGVRLEQASDGVRVAEVVADSLAEKSGLKTGDRLMEVGGQPAKGLMPVISSIRQQPGGSWLPMRIKRGEETLELVVKFPATP